MTQRPPQTIATWLKQNYPFQTTSMKKKKSNNELPYFPFKHPFQKGKKTKKTHDFLLKLCKFTEIKQKRRKKTIIAKVNASIP